MKTPWALLLSLIQIFEASGQLLDGQAHSYTRADSLRGYLFPERTCFNVLHYDLDIEVFPETKSIKGKNTIRMVMVRESNKIQLDLFQNLKISRIVYKKNELTFNREHNAFFVFFDESLPKGEHVELEIHYEGKPKEARRPPWDGGFVWASDLDSNHWAATACQGVGASLWWPNKDHQSDEPDEGMLIGVTVPNGYWNISNGKLLKKRYRYGKVKYEWQVQNPINNYNVALNLGKYVGFSEDFESSGGDVFTLDYFVMPYNLKVARGHFKDVPKTLEAFEHYFGPYPFAEDGFKLVETPYLGMEHQSAIAYGNKYLKGYLGSSSSPYGLLFDFIIVHETAHEWWGNSVTASDNADLWIHEAFANYSESLFLEYHYGYDKGQHYINSNKDKVLLDRPIQGVYGVNQEGSRDMYWKGGLILNTLRHAIGNDSVFFGALKSLAMHFKKKVTDYDEFTSYFSKQLGQDYSGFFSQYIRHTPLPLLEIVIAVKGKEKRMKYRWVAEAENFSMPIVLDFGERSLEILPSSKWQILNLKNFDEQKLTIDTSRYFIEHSVGYQYLDSELD